MKLHVYVYNKQYYQECLEEERIGRFIFGYTPYLQAVTHALTRYTVPSSQIPGAGAAILQTPVTQCWYSSTHFGSEGPSCLH